MSNTKILPAGSKMKLVDKNTVDLMSKIHLLIDSISSLTGEQYTLENFAQAILKIGVDLTPSEIAWFYKMDFSKNCLERLGANSKQEKISPRLIEISDHNAVCQVARNGTVKIIKDSKTQNLKAIQSTKYRSQIILPMKRGELTIGVLVFASTLPNAFSDEEIRILHLFSLLAASAFDQAKLRLHLQMISKSILQGYDVLQNAIVHATNDLTGKSVALWLLDEAIDELTVTASLGISENFKKKAKIKYVGVDNSLIAHAFLEKQPVNIENLNNAGSGITVKLRDLLNKEKWNTALIIPIFDSAEKPIGALALKNFVDQKFSKFEVDFLLNFANQIAVAFEEVQVQKKLESLADIGKFAFQDVTADVSPVLKRIADAGCKITGADYIAIFPYHRYIPNYYDNKNIVVSGPDEFKFKEKPRARGLTVITREIDEIVVYNVQEGEISESSQKRLQQSGFGIEEAVERIQNANFIKTKEIKSFVGISIKAKRYGTKKAGLSENVGMLYIDFAHDHRITEKELDWIRIFSQQVGNVIYNARLLDDLNSQAKRRQALITIGVNLSRIHEESRILCEIAHTAVQYRDHCTVFRVKENQLVVAVSEGIFADVVHPGRIFKVGQGVAGWVALHGKAALVTNTAQDLRFEPGWHIQSGDSANDHKSGPESMAVVPVSINDAVYGVISVEQKSPSAFEERDLEFLQILAQQTSSAVENARLMKRLENLNEISREISSKLDIQDILNCVVRAIVEEFLDSNHCTFFVKEGSKLIPKAFYNKSGQKVSNRTFKLGEGLVGSVAQTGKTKLATGDALREKSFVEGKDNPDAVERSMILVSVKTAGDIYGVISVNQDRLNAFSEQDQQFVESLALQIGIAVGIAASYEEINAHLEQANFQLDKKVNNLNAVIEMGKQLTGSVDLSEKQVLDLIYEKLHPLMNTENMYIALYDHATDIVRFSIMYVDGKEKQVQARKAGSGRTEYIITTKKPLSIQTREESIAWYKQQGHTDYIQEPFASWIGVPMISGSRVIGVIATYHLTNNHEYDQDDLDVLQAIANQAAIALEVTQRVSELKALQGLTSDLSAGFF